MTILYLHSPTVRFFTLNYLYHIEYKHFTNSAVRPYFWNNEAFMSNFASKKLPK